jgi:hypothetical protein
MPNAALQLRLAIIIQAARIRLLEKHAIAPSAASAFGFRVSDKAVLRLLIGFFSNRIGVASLQTLAPTGEIQRPA